jgi:hypothetical protein
LLSASVARTNKTISLDGSSKSKRKNFTPRPIRISQNALLKKYKHFQKVLKSGDTSKIASIKKDYNKARDLHRKLERRYKAEQSSLRDETLFSICTSNPSPIFKSIKSAKRSTAGKIQKLSVGLKVYHGDSVQDGFYDSISQLKTRDSESLKDDIKFNEFSADYQNILEVCKNGSPIPPISETDSFKLIQKQENEKRCH